MEYSCESCNNSEVKRILSPRRPVVGNSETQPVCFECRSTMTNMSRIKGPSVEDKA